jgi:hypothetical protein
MPLSHDNRPPFLEQLKRERRNERENGWEVIFPPLVVKPRAVYDRKNHDG